METAIAKSSEVVHDSGHLCLHPVRWCGGNCDRARSREEAQGNIREGKDGYGWCPIWEAGDCKASLPVKPHRISLEVTDREYSDAVQCLKDAGFDIT